ETLQRIIEEGHLVGEYETVSGYALWLACKMLRNVQIPEILKENDVLSQPSGKILLYNQYMGHNHSLILIDSCEV
ncbi:MAG: hypothetical protein WCD31_13925, partial [Gillisia sp.]